MIKRLCIVLSVLTLVGCGGKPSTQNDEAKSARKAYAKETHKSGTAIDTLISNKAMTAQYPSSIRRCGRKVYLHMYRATAACPWPLEQARSLRDIP